MNNYHELIVKRVNDSSGIGSIKLSLDVMTEIGPGNFNITSYVHELEYAVKKGEIVELEFIVPTSSHKMSSLYFPKGTIFHSLAGKKLG